MRGKSPGPEGRIAAEIAAGGPIGFDRFMEIALYDSDGGYYTADRIGKGGDFFTNVSLGPVYGEVLAGQFLEMWEALGRPEDFTLVEQGANDGRLACDVLAALDRSPLKGVRIILIEPCDALRTAQAAALAGRRAEWVGSPEDLPVLCGAHFSNELFDALPVRVVRSTGGGWSERFVGGTDDGFFWVDGPLSSEAAGMVAGFPARPAGFTTEVCARYPDILAPLAKRFRAGFLLAVDYGMSVESLLAAHRHTGTLRCYAAHRRESDPLAEPGRRDITAHVNFSQLARDAERAGWTLEKFADQHHFLVGAATRMLLEMEGAPDPERLGPLKALLHPENMGRQFHAILFSRNADGSSLSGFRHARDSDLPA